MQVWVYTNGDAVELILNGRTVGKVDVAPLDQATFTVAYEPGVLAAVATRGGKAWAEDRTATAGPPAAVVLELEELMAEERVTADGQDATLLTATVVDANGTLVRHS